MTNILQIIFFLVVVRPLVLIVLGLNIRDRDKFPKRGPAIIAANHNSHLDTLVLMSLFPLKNLKTIRPVAAIDYFFSNPFLKYFSLNIMNIIPLSRRIKSFHSDPLEPISTALANNEIVIIFPEGTRGEPEVFSKIKSGISHLSDKNPQVPITPVLMHGLGKALPNGEGLLVPFFCDIYVGNSIHWSGNKGSFMNQLQQEMAVLEEKGNFKQWR